MLVVGLGLLGVISYLKQSSIWAEIKETAIPL
jgi:hypothetical protein